LETGPPASSQLDEEGEQVIDDNSGTVGATSCDIVQADCIEFLRAQPADSVDLVFGSPPYMDARTYGIDAVRGCHEWVEWMLDVSEAAIHASKGLVAWVVGGVQRKCNYWPGCEGLIWEWYKRGHYQWVPCVWWKVDENEGGTGIPGSGGKQAFRKDWEYVLMFRKSKELPWADNTAMGREPVYDRVGGEMSNRTVEGRRINDHVGDGPRQRRDTWGTGNQTGIGGRRQNGEKKTRKKRETMDTPAGTNGDGTRKENGSRPMPKIANPGNVLPIVVKARVGGGHIGNVLGHESEAPFPEKLAEFFVQSFCPPGGLCLDPFSGSGTTAAMCRRHRRNFTGCDLRQSQVDLGLKRVANEQPLMFV
jgi:site-specific DNA-methyltransferase (adenine-specific)